MKTLGRVFVTGDTHGGNTMGKFSKKNWPVGKELNKKDVVIVAGDFGMLWSYLRTRDEDYWLKWLDDQPFTVLFVDGNHENFDLLDNLQEKEMFGGRVGIVSHSVFHLRRGVVYRINGQKILTLGGAHSHDRIYRSWGKSMWHQEEITDKNICDALDNIGLVDNNVDAVITHCAPPNWARIAMPREDVCYYAPDPSEEKLEFFRDNSEITFNKWFFGHYHTDVQDDYGDKWQALYHKIVELKKETV